MACEKPVRVVDKNTGNEYELIPIRVWQLISRNRRGVRIGLFRNPETGKYFRAKVPDDYPEC